MAIFDVGRVCRKISGRDAGQYCVILEKVDGGFMVEGPQARKKKVSGSHLEPTAHIVGTKDVSSELSKLGLN